MQDQTIPMPEKTTTLPPGTKDSRKWKWVWQPERGRMKLVRNHIPRGPMADDPERVAAAEAKRARRRARNLRNISGFHRVPSQ